MVLYLVIVTVSVVIFNALVPVLVRTVTVGTVIVIKYKYNTTQAGLRRPKAA